MKELTKAEEQIMQILWKLKKGFVNDIIAEIPEPKPAYNTVSTIVRILETKEFVSHNAYGKTHEYFPLISKEEYTFGSLNKLVSDYFGNSYHDLVSFFTRRDNISVNELEQIKNLIDQELKTKKFNSHEQTNVFYHFPCPTYSVQRQPRENRYAARQRKLQNLPQRSIRLHR